MSIFLLSLSKREGIPSVFIHLVQRRLKGSRAIAPWMYESRAQPLSLLLSSPSPLDKGLEISPLLLLLQISQHLSLEVAYKVTPRMIPPFPLPLSREKGSDKRSIAMMQPLICPLLPHPPPPPPPSFDGNRRLSPLRRVLSESGRRKEKYTCGRLRGSLD